MMETIKINRMKSPTNRWLRINDTDLALPEVPVVSEVKPQILSGAGEAFDAFVASRSVPELIEVKQGDKERKVLEIKGGFTFADIRIGRNGSLNLIVDVKDSGEDAYILVNAKLSDYAKLNIIKRVDTKSAVHVGFGASVGDSAEVAAYDIFLGGSVVTYGSRVSLEGFKSAYNAYVGYITKGREKLDLNYLTDHIGKNTQSELTVGGVMKDSSEKTFRGTIDFIRGCSGSVASENENVILMNQGVKNRSVPSILCTEEEVKGSHGESIGKIEDDIRFYLGSRGLDEEEIVKLVSESKIMNVINKIPDEEFRNELLNGGSEDE